MRHRGITIDVLGAISITLFQADRYNRESIKHTPSSPGLTPSDFHFWEYLHDAVYRIKPAALEELRKEV
jgi:hypothetical protein